MYYLHEVRVCGREMRSGWENLPQKLFQVQPMQDAAQPKQLPAGRRHHLLQEPLSGVCRSQEHASHDIRRHLLTDRKHRMQFCPLPARMGSLKQADRGQLCRWTR
ncbi:hypothetical protein NP493_479g01018 [Ridgeia piscesae]|uniref:Uncharacterized protein n=1 Tax=Ridgeia piscesae TaxID=27915 RepID=A0AAD9NT29_RIDPI|nr:hypothetical protein NP493_479g01018 [Ridgeia piscesae]